MENEESVQESVQEKTPWFVGEEVEMLPDDMPYPVMVVRPVAEAGTFKLEVDALKWIRENGEDNTILRAYRKGRGYKISLVRKSEEI